MTSYKIKIIYSFLLQFAVIALSGQEPVAPGRYRVEFTDKDNNVFTTDRPGEFLSERALQRRVKQNIPVTQSDLPVSQYYTDSLARLGFDVLHTSKWFNSAVIRCDASDTVKLQDLSFIRKRSPLREKITGEPVSQQKADLGRFFSFIFQKEEDFDGKDCKAPSGYYGDAVLQTDMLNGHVLHNHGFRGKGILIAVIDAGFHKSDRLSGFERMRKEDRLKGVRNFTVEEGIFGENSHGANVLSIIASDLPGRMVGSAPDADFLLIRSEESSGEYIVEEDNWIAAVEYADSTGADLVTSSLGYSVFDDPSQNHTWDEMDGSSIRASKAAAMAAGKGMIVCVSAGNDGDLSWKYISAPADADSVLTIGAVDRNGRYVSFSSTGFTADRRIKPDLMAMGKQTAFQGSSGMVTRSNGTSYSTPLLAGFMACVWQAFPCKNNMEIIGMVKKTADRFHEPDSLYGYGLPDFSKLFETEPAFHGNKMKTINCPVSENHYFILPPAQHGEIEIRIFSVTGKEVYKSRDYTEGYNFYEFSASASEIVDPGVYTVEAKTDAGHFFGKIIR